MIEFDHPVIDTYYTIGSNEISRVCEIAMDRVFMRRTGVIFYGPARLGKTRCSEVLKECLSKYCPKVYVNWISVVNRQGQCITNIIRQLCLHEGYRKKTRETMLDELNQLVDLIEARVRERGCNQYVCIVDELQRLRNSDYYQLADLYNLLDSRRIKMTVLSFAMPEIFVERQKFYASEERQIIARFMSEMIEFKGCVACTDIEAIFRGFDLFTEFPAGSGISYTKGFLPKAFEGGFRLERYAEMFWDVMNSYASGPYVNNLPMAHVLMAVSDILIKLSAKDSAGVVLSKAQIASSVESSSFKGFCKTGAAGEVQ